MGEAMKMGIGSPEQQSPQEITPAQEKLSRGRELKLKLEEKGVDFSYFDPNSESEMEITRDNEEDIEEIKYKNLEDETIGSKIFLLKGISLGAFYNPGISDILDRNKLRGINIEDSFKLCKVVKLNDKHFLVFKGENRQEGKMIKYYGLYLSTKDEEAEVTELDPSQAEKLYEDFEAIEYLDEDLVGTGKGKEKESRAMREIKNHDKQFKEKQKTLESIGDAMGLLE